MTISFVTEGAASYAADCKGDVEEHLAFVSKKGHGWLRKAGLRTRSDDMAFLAYQVWTGVSELKHAGRLDDDYEVANEVLDQYVTDHDAELLVEIVPEVRAQAGEQVGGMTHEVTAVHSWLLAVAAVMREAWEEDESDA